jgi:release factor glutamine methyltransferase
MQQRSWNLLEILNQTSGFFSDKSINNARLQAELLLADVLDVGRLDLYLQFERVLSPAEVDQYRQHVRQRLQNVPLQYIIGKAAFRELTLHVSNEVLIPRPETEILVGTCLEYLSDTTKPYILDLGCGSGAIGVSLAYECTTSRVAASDISAKAIEVAQRNAVESGVADRLRFFEGDLFVPLPVGEVFSLIASNPPYIVDAELATLDPEVRDHEPRLALDGGKEGLDYYRRIVVDAPSFLEINGILVLEVGHKQATDVATLLNDAGMWQVVETRPDLNGIPRVVVARKTS